MDVAPTTIVCAKCGFERHMPDTEPSWCCPRCKVVYAKATASPISPKRATHSSRSLSPTVRPLTACIVVLGALVCAGLIGAYGLHVSARRAQAEAVVDAHLREVAAAKHLQQAYEWDTGLLLRRSQNWIALMTEIESSPRITVPSFYARMDALIAGTQVMQVSPCLISARDELAQSMTARKQQVLEFVAGDDSPSGAEADAHETAFLAAMAGCKPGAKN